MRCWCSSTPRTWWQKGRSPPPASKGFGGRTGLGYGTAEDSLRPPVWLGKDYQLQRIAGGAPGVPSNPLPDPWWGRWSGWSRWSGELGSASYCNLF
jgi:hypothetical protein